MTDRIKGFIVTLNEDYREDDVQAIVTAIKMVKGVLSVDALVRDHTDLMARQRVRQELLNKVWAVLTSEDTP